MKIKPRVNMAGLIVFILILVVAAIAATIGLNVQTNLKESACTDAGYYWNTTTIRCEANSSSGGGIRADTLAYNATEDAQLGISNLTGQFPNIGLVVGAVVIIGLLIGGFAFAFRGGGGVSAI